MKIIKTLFKVTGVYLASVYWSFAMATGGLDATLTKKLAPVQTALVAIGGVTVTIALLYVGMKMVFQAAEWKDVAPVFWGAVLIGGASAIASSLIN